MRRLSCASLIMAATLLALAGPAAAKAPVREFIEHADFEFPAGEVCSFAVSVESLRGRGHSRVWEEEDATVHTKITGSLVARLTNLATGESVVRNLSGPVDQWEHPDGTATVINRGHTLAWLTPAEGGPALWAQAGTILWSVDEEGLFSVVRQTGRTEDLCATLS